MIVPTEITEGLEAASKYTAVPNIQLAAGNATAGIKLIQVCNVASYLVLSKTTLLTIVSRAGSPNSRHKSPTAHSQSSKDSN